MGTLELELERQWNIWKLGSRRLVWSSIQEDARQGADAGAPRPSERSPLRHLPTSRNEENEHRALRPETTPPEERARPAPEARDDTALEARAPWAQPFAVARTAATRWRRSWIEKGFAR